MEASEFEDSTIMCSWIMVVWATGGTGARRLRATAPDSRGVHSGQWIARVGREIGETSLGA